MASASKKHEQASDFRFGTDNHLSSQKERSRQRAVKFSAVVIRSRIDGIQDSYLQDRSFGHCVQRISGQWIKTGLQVKIQNSSCGDSNRNDWTLTRSGTGKQTDETQNCNDGTMHEPGLLPQKNKSNTIILSSPRDTVNAKRGNEWRILYRSFEPAVEATVEERVTSPPLSHHHTCGSAYGGTQ